MADPALSGKKAVPMSLNEVKEFSFREHQTRCTNCSSQSNTETGIPIEINLCGARTRSQKVSKNGVVTNLWQWKAHVMSLEQNQAKKGSKIDVRPIEDSTEVKDRR